MLPSDIWRKSDLAIILVKNKCSLWFFCWVSNNDFYAYGYSRLCSCSLLYLSPSPGPVMLSCALCDILEYDVSGSPSPSAIGPGTVYIWCYDVSGSPSPSAIGPGTVYMWYVICRVSEIWNLLEYDVLWRHWRAGDHISWAHAWFVFRN